MTQIKIFPEPHIRDKNFMTRTDYLAEIEGYMGRFKQNLFNQSQLMSKTDKLIAIFPGDLFDNSMSDLTTCIKWLKYFAEISEITKGNVYSAVGNHEITYKIQNPFWMLADPKSEWVKDNDFYSMGISSIFPIVKVVDELQVDNLLIVFGHYQRDLSKYTDSWILEHFKGITEVIVMTHNEIVSDAIRNHFNEYLGFDVLQGRGSFRNYKTCGTLPPTRLLKHIYVGHMHTALGDFDDFMDIPRVKEGKGVMGLGSSADSIGETGGLRGAEFSSEETEDTYGSERVEFTLHYLASTGRTNITEVRNDFLTRYIPTITLTPQRGTQDCNLGSEYPMCKEAISAIEYGREEFKLVGENVILDRAEYIRRKEKYNSAVELRTLRSTELSITDPSADLKVLLFNKPRLREYFINAMSAKMPVDLENLLNYADVLMKERGPVNV